MLFIRLHAATLHLSFVSDLLAPEFQQLWLPFIAQPLLFSLNFRREFNKMQLFPALWLPGLPLYPSPQDAIWPAKHAGSTKLRQRQMSRMADPPGEQTKAKQKCDWDTPWREQDTNPTAPKTDLYALQISFWSKVGKNDTFM